MAIDPAGRRSEILLCDTEQAARVLALQLADAAPRIQARIDSAPSIARAVRLSRSRAERLAEYPRITVTLPPSIVAWLSDECARRRLGLSDLVGRIIGARMIRGLGAGDDD